MSLNSSRRGTGKKGLGFLVVMLLVLAWALGFAIGTTSPYTGTIPKPGLGGTVTLIASPIQITNIALDFTANTVKVTLQNQDTVNTLSTTVTVDLDTTVLTPQPTTIPATQSVTLTFQSTTNLSTFSTVTVKD